MQTPARRHVGATEATVHPAEVYELLMEPVLSGDIGALETLARDHAPFPLGTDPWLQRHWLTNAIDCG